MKVLDYDVVGGETISALRSAVKKAIEKGWQPLGGIVINNGTFFQAMILVYS